MTAMRSDSSSRAHGNGKPSARSAGAERRALYEQVKTWSRPDSQGQPPHQRSVETNNWQDNEKLGLDWSRVCSAVARSGSRSQKPTLRTGPFPQVKLKIEARNTT